jgi:CubicO group peptidase (beta-lactamase class C family)
MRTSGTLESIVDCGNQRGTVVPSNAGFAVVGQLIADVTGEFYPDAVARLVFEPLSMRDSSFPTAWPDKSAVTGYHLADDGTFEPAPAHVCTMPAAGGMWTTAADLVRLGDGWTSLLPADLVAEPLRPQATHTIAAGVGLGWLVHPNKSLFGHPGGGPGGAASLIVRPNGNETAVACANRHTRIEPVAARLPRPIGVGA